MIPALDDFRQRVKQLRNRAGLTQEEAAKAADVSQSFVTKVERGTTVPRYDRAAALYNTLESRARGNVETAADMLEGGIVAASPEDTVRETSRRMKENGFSQLPVIEDDRCVGSVTSRDLLSADPDDAVAEHMAAPFPEIPAATPRDTVVELLRTENAVIVRDETGISGILTAADVL